MELFEDWPKEARLPAPPSRIQWFQTDHGVYRATFDDETCTWPPLKVETYDEAMSSAIVPAHDGIDPPSA
jgi:hypothetical protein